MKFKTNELTGPLLDAAVAKYMGWEYRVSLYMLGGEETTQVFLVKQPSTKWADGGPVIEAWHIQLDVGIDSGERFWVACCHPKLEGGTFKIGGQSASVEVNISTYKKSGHGDGPTALIAAMRAFVMMNSGDEVEL
jgi:hypothetical protein